MESTQIKKQFDTYIPLLAPKQQMAVLEMIKGLVDIGNDSIRISQKQYNKELEDAVIRIENGQFKTHNEALDALAKW